MNTILFSISTMIIIASHLFAITLLETPKMTTPSKPKYQKISMQFAQVEPIKPIKEQKVIKKEAVKKEKFIKPITKDAQKKLEKKKKIIKKEVKKKLVKKVIKKRVQAKKIIKAPIKKVKKSAPKETAESIKKYKKFKNDYITKLRSAIDKNKKYPNISKRFKEEGKVTISFRVLKNGTFTNVKVIEKSKKKRLNEAALNAVLITQKFDPFPKELSKKEFLDIFLPITFKLQ